MIKPMNKIVLVTGGRDYRNRQELDDALDRVSRERKIWFILNGGADGADRMSSQWAKKRGIRFTEIHADWYKYDREAGGKRNQWMIDHFPVSVAVAFPGGAGTRDMIERLGWAQIPVIKILPPTVPGIERVEEDDDVESVPSVPDPEGGSP